jgi:hypothetical protein
MIEGGAAAIANQNGKVKSIRLLTSASTHNASGRRARDGRNHRLSFASASTAQALSGVIIRDARMRPRSSAIVQRREKNKSS